MKKVVKAVLATAIAALAAAAPAMAQTDTPVLQVIPYVTGLGAQTDTELDLTIPAAAPATARVVIYVPTGYRANLTQPAGSKIGDAIATVDVRGTSLPGLQGQIVADDPAKYAADPRAQACAPGTHAAVWVIQIQLQTQTLNIPMFVDATTPTDAALGAYKIVTCFASPDVPEAQGGAPLGAKLTEGDLDFTSAFTNPPSASIYVWRALVTPYTSGTGTPNPQATYELRSDAFIPVRFALKARWDRKHRVAVFTGSVKIPEASVTRIAFIGTTSLNTPSFKLIGTAKVKKGKFTFKKRLKRTTYVFAFVPPQSGSCDPSLPTAAPAGCALETTAPLLSNRAKVTPRGK